MSIQVRFLEPDEYHLIDDFFDREKCPRLDPQWSKVIAAIDSDSTRVIGIMCLQLVAHAEPIIIDPAYRGNGVWREMAEVLDGYLTEMARQGAIAGIYNQPTHEMAEHLCEEMGMIRCEHPLWMKIYNPEYRDLIPEGGQ